MGAPLNHADILYTPPMPLERPGGDGRSEERARFCAATHVPWRFVWRISQALLVEVLEAPLNRKVEQAGCLP